MKFIYQYANGTAACWAFANQTNGDGGTAATGAGDGGARYCAVLPDRAVVPCAVEDGRMCWDADEDATHTRLTQISTLMAAVTLLIFMTGVGMYIDLEGGAKLVKRKWKAPAVGFVSQIFVNPFFLFALISWLGSDLLSNQRFAAMLVACSPGGNGSNLLTWIARGTLEISVAMTVASTAASFATIPTFMYLGEQVFAAEGDSLSIPISNIVLSLAGTLGALAFGAWLQRRKGRAALHAASRRAMGAAVALAIVLIVLYLSDPVTGAYVLHGTKEVYAVAVVMNFAGLALGYAVATLVRLPAVYRRTISFEVGAQNVTIPLAIVALSFETGSLAQSQYVSFLFVYAVAQFVVNFSVALAWRYLAPVPDQPEEIAASAGGVGASPTAAVAGGAPVVEVEVA